MFCIPTNNNGNCSSSSPMKGLILDKKNNTHLLERNYKILTSLSKLLFTMLLKPRILYLLKN